MFRWFVLAALVAACCVPMADAQQRDSSKDFTLAYHGHAIWSDGSTMYTLQPGGQLYAYLMSNQQRDTSQDSGWLPGAIDPVAIWASSSTIYLTDNINNKILAYHTNNTRDSSKDITLASGNNAPAGIWSNGATMWVADHDHDKLYAYSMSSKSRASSKDITLASGNALPWGIWSDDTTIWVADINAFQIYAYNISTKQPDSSKNLPTVSDNRPLGVWSDGTTMWVLDFTVSKLYAYVVPSGSTGSSGPIGQSSSSTAQSKSFLATPPPDTTPPTVVSVERTGNATTADHTLIWNVTFSEPVMVNVNMHINYTSVANVIIPDLGAVNNTMSVDVPGTVTGGSVSVDLEHFITAGLLIELVAPDCTKFTIHNQTTTFPYKLRQPYDLGDLSGVGAAGQWELHVSDHAKHWNGTLNGWTLYLESEDASHGNEIAHTITRHVAGPGEYPLSLDEYGVRDWAGNPLDDTDPEVNEPYNMIGAARTCME